MKKIIYITKDYCIKNNCKLVKNGAVDIDTCKGCCVGTIYENTHYKRTDNHYEQLTIFDFI